MNEAQEKILQSYKLQRGQFYFGYATFQNPVLKFLRNVILYDEGNPEPLNVVIKCTTPPRLAMTLSLMGATKKNLRSAIELEFAGQNIGTVYVNGEVICRGSGKTLNITLIGDECIPHEHMITLIKASKEFCLLTGDQSFSEGISMGKMVMYEGLRHKGIFFHEFLGISRLVGGQEFANLLQETYLPFDIQHTEGDVRLISQLKQPQTKELYQRLNREIVDKHNIEKNLLLLIKAFYARWR